MNARFTSWRCGSVALVVLAVFAGGCSLSLSLDPQQGQSAAVARGSATESSTATLVRLLDSEDPQVRSVAVRGLAEMGSNAKGAAPALHRLIDDDDRQVRYEAAKALAVVNPDDPALPAMLVAVANDQRTPEEQRVELRSLLLRVRPMAVIESSSHQEIALQTSEPGHIGNAAAETAETGETRSVPTTRPTGLEIVNSGVTPTTRPIMASERSEQINEAASSEAVNTAVPTTRPTTRPVSANSWEDIPGLTGLASAPRTDPPPTPDINLFGYRSYTSSGAVQVKDWIHRQQSISEQEKQARVKEFQDWRYAQDKLIYQKVLER